VPPSEFGDYTYSQLVAMIDSEKLSRFNDRYFDVSGVVGNMSDEGVSDAIHGRKKGGHAARGKLIDQMLRPYTPTFMLPEVASVKAARPLEGLSPKTAEGIMQAVERKLVPHEQWLGIVKVWQRIHATAQRYRP